MTDRRDPEVSTRRLLLDGATSVMLLAAFLIALIGKQWTAAVIFAVLIVGDQITDAIDTGFGDARRARQAEPWARWRP